MLMDDFKAPCVFMVEGENPDGEGGQNIGWKEDAGFDAAIIHNDTIEAKAAEKQGAVSQYDVYTGDVCLRYHDVFKRLSDGKVFRVTSNGDDVQTPRRATFQFSKVTAEEYTLPDGGAV